MAYFNQYIPFIKKLYPSYLLWNKKNLAKEIYLTFDDGPVPVITEYVLEVLSTYNIKATFFCVGDNVRKYPEVFHNIIAQGHQVGNHTYNHWKGWGKEDDKYIQNVHRCEGAFEQLIPSVSRTKFFRPPYGKAKKSQLAALSKDYRIVMWDVLTGDFDATQSGEQCLQQALKYTRSGSIIIFHDSYKAEQNLRYALPRFIEQCLRKGYRFGVL